MDRTSVPPPADTDERRLYTRPAHAPMECQRCSAPINPGTAFVLETPVKREHLCGSCHTTAVIQAGAKFNTQRIPLGPTFEYHLIRLADDLAGNEGIENELNRLAAAGWRLLPLAVRGGLFGVMEREAARG